MHDHLSMQKHGMVCGCALLVSDEQEYAKIYSFSQFWISHIKVVCVTNN